MCPANILQGQCSGVHCFTPVSSSLMYIAPCVHMNSCWFLLMTETLKLLQRLLKSPGCRKIPVLVQNKDDVIVTASNFSSERYQLCPVRTSKRRKRRRNPFFPFFNLCLFSPRMCPIFQISNVTGENMDLLKMFLNLLSSRTSYRDDQPAEFQIDDTYSVPVRCQQQVQTSHLIQTVSYSTLNHWLCCLYVSGSGNSSIRNDFTRTDTSE